MTDADITAAVDSYFEQKLLGEDEVLKSALKASEAAGLEPISVSPLQGRQLTILAMMSGARRILEIGTLGGYSGICLARALPEHGQLVTLELDPHTANTAEKNFEAAGLADKIDIRVGPARDTLDEMIAAGEAPFDFVFIDADKEGYAEYLSRVMKLARPGTVIVGDNVVRRGGVIDPDHEDSRVHGVRAFTDALASADVMATAIQTVGSKGYDGFTIAIVR